VQGEGEVWGLSDVASSQITLGFLVVSTSNTVDSKDPKGLKAVIS